MLSVSIASPPRIGWQPAGYPSDVCSARHFVTSLKALVWFWIIDETLALTSILSVCRLNEVGTCQVMEQVMIMVMMVMTQSDQVLNLEKNKEKNKTLWRSRQRYCLEFWFW